MHTHSDLTPVADGNNDEGSLTVVASVDMDCKIYEGPIYLRICFFTQVSPRHSIPLVQMVTAWRNRSYEAKIS
jgi:hypothetical protein